MNLNLSDNALMAASIFDLTDDKSVLSELAPWASSKEEYLTSVTESARVFDMIVLAEMQGNDEEQKRLNLLFASSKTALFNE